MLLSACAAALPALEGELAAVTERAYVAPREALYTLAKIQAAHAPLSPRHQALVYEQLSSAKFYTGDPAGAVQDARLLEALGKQQHDESAECLGLLSQVYGNWAIGKIEAAYQFSRRAARFSPAKISATARIKSLLTTAQVESEEHRHQSALRTVNEALRLAGATGDDALLFMASRIQAFVAITANDMPLALTAVDRLLTLGLKSPYRERLVRAKDMEYTVASAAGLTARASEAMAERIRLMRELRLDESLGRTLVEYSDLQLKSNRHAEAAALSEEALSLETVLADEQLASRAHFNHAIATIHLGNAAEGKAEVERLFQSKLKRTQLLVYLPRYIAALTHAGEVNAAVQAGALHEQIELDEAVHRAKAEEKAQGQIASLARLRELKDLEAINDRAQRNVWLIAAVLSGSGLIGMLFLYWRLRVSTRLLEASNRQLYISSNRDSLTGLFNRRYVENYVAGPSPSLADFHSPVGHGLVLLMDIDHFKRLNDTYGHAVGDQVLQSTAARLSALFRSDDIVVRWGGEEFLALLPTAHASEAESIAARILAAVSAKPIVVDCVTMNVTVSVGICRLKLDLNDREMNWEEVVLMADQALYLAKQNGRNMAYGLLAAVKATSVEMARGLRINWTEGKVQLLQVNGA
ncbi:MAG: GGDEF domain-containing protein [Pseudomonadota bacterium]